MIDFAHDHQSIQNILSELANYHDEIILVFGCGGDRDRSKRSKMMKVAQDFASKVFLHQITIVMNLLLQLLQMQWSAILIQELKF